jgi:hypothetical protein
VDVDSAAVKGVWWRHLRAGLDPHGRPPDPPDGRWQTGSTVEAIYLGQRPETVWAEWYRFAAERGLPPDLALPRDLWRWEIEVEEVADLSDRHRLARVGLPMPLPHQGNWPAYQGVGNELFRLGWKGLVAPSAARPDDLVLCLFRGKEDEVAGAAPVPPPERIDRPPPVPTKMRT